MSSLSDLWREIWTPSPRDETLYAWSIIALAHASFGAALAWASAWFFQPSILTAAGAALAYFVLKEYRDLRRKGSMADSIVDAGFVGLGAASPLVPAYPIIVFGAVIAGILIKSAKG